jgi:hypothetical protein
MWMRLAALWHTTVDEAQRRCSARDFTEWRAFFALEPWGHEGEWQRSGAICATMANAWRGSRGRTFEPEDFKPKLCITRRLTKAERTAKALALKAALSSAGALK